MTPEQKELFRWRFAAKYMLRGGFSTCNESDQAAKSVEAADKLVAALEKDSPQYSECDHDYRPVTNARQCWHCGGFA